MDPNFEGPKIPLMTLAGITSLTDVLHELPLPSPHPDTLEYSLFSYPAVPMPGIKRLANSSNHNNVLNVVEALSRVSTDEIVLKDPLQDSDCLDGLTVPPLLQAVLISRPDIFYRKKSMTGEMGGNITGKHNSPVQAATPQSPAISHKGLPLYQRSPAECASETSSHRQQDGHHLPGSLRDPNVHSIVDAAGSSRTEFAVENSQQPKEEAPKIRLKIKRKKPTKDQAQNSVNSSEDLGCSNGIQYDIISGPGKQLETSSSGTLKLKLTRVKPEPGSSIQQPLSELTGTLNPAMTSLKQPTNHTSKSNQEQTVSGSRLPDFPAAMGVSNQSNFSMNSRSYDVTDVQNSGQGMSQLGTGFPTSTNTVNSMVNELEMPSHKYQVQPSPSFYPGQAQAQPLQTSYLNSPGDVVRLPPASADVPRRRYSQKSSEGQSRSTSKSKKKTSQHIRVKFIADQEEADIYKLSDILYPDDSEVSSFDELKSGMMVIAKWPQNGKMYEALVIDHLENTGRKFRERKPPVKPFQVDQGNRQTKGSNNIAGFDSPVVVLEQLPMLNHQTQGMKFSVGNQFTAYHSMADRIKLKRKQRMSDAGSAKKQKKGGENLNRSMITVSSDDDNEERDRSWSQAKLSGHSKRKQERRRMAELRMMQEGGTSTGSLKRFNVVMELIFEDMETLDPEVYRLGPNDPVPDCLLIPPSRMRELSSESAKLKAMGILSQVSTKSLIHLLKCLEPNIRSAISLNPLLSKGNVPPQEEKWEREKSMERVHAATDAAVTALSIMTCPGMAKAVFIEDVMESAIQLLRFQLTNTIYPEYDTVYKAGGTKHSKASKDLHFSSIKQKRAHYKGTKSRPVAYLYNKMIHLMTLWVELLEIQPLTDTSVLQVSSVAISPFFVENVRELQLSAIRLTTIVFAQYERHRKIILEDIFQSLARLPTSKRNLRSFKLNYTDGYCSDDEDSTDQVAPYIQMVSALVLQMIQAIVTLDLVSDPEEKDGEQAPQIDDLLVMRSYDNAMRTGQSFLAVFLKKCAGKSEEIDYRPLFENFIHDLLATVNKPEWPASEMMLSILGRLLVHTFTNKQTEASLRVASIDYLGIIAAKLRRDAVSSQLDKNIIRQLILNLENAAKKEVEDEQTLEEKGSKSNEDEGEQKDEEKNENHQKSEDDEADKTGTTMNEEHVLENQLHDIVLEYIKSNAEADPALTFAHNFYIGQWLRDIVRESAEIQNSKKKVSHDEVQAMEAASKALQECEKRKMKILQRGSEAAADNASRHDFLKTEEIGAKSVPKTATPMKRKMKSVCSQLTYEDATLMTKYLASSRPFSHAFDSYLTHILHIREESSVAVRTRAIKCLTEVVSVDPGILSRNDIWQGVQVSLMDASTSVREAAVDLVGRFILLKPELVPQYYKMLSARILDTGVSVRKRVIRILRDLCHEHPDLPQLTDACVKMIRRVNDEEGIKKLVHEVFMKMWFTPLKNKDAGSMRLKALSVADVVAANRDIGYEWIEQMMVDLVAAEDENKSVDLACQQIVNCLIDHLIQIEQEKNNKQDQPELNSSSDATKNKKDKLIADALKGRKYEEMIAATMRTLVLFAKIRPKLLVVHVMTLQPYLATKCESADELQTLQSVCSVLDMAVPLLEHPGEDFLASLEENLMRLILREKFLVVKSAIACLGSVTKHITHNYKLVWECFQKLGTYLHSMRSLHQKSEFCQAFNIKVSQLLRTLYITGHLMKTFDFDEEQVKGSMQICVKDRVYDCIYYFTQLDGHHELQRYAVGALGLLMIQDPNMMFRTETKECYMKLLSPEQEVDSLKSQVLLNLQTYLSDEDVRMQEAAKASAHKIKEDPVMLGLHARKQLEMQQQQEESEDIKEICDVSSGMASSVMQVYLKQVLECFFHPHIHVRHAALNTIYLTLTQGLVHPMQCVPYVIAMSTDLDSLVFGKSEQLLNEVGKRYSGFIHATSLQGVKMAFKLQQAITKSDEVTRGIKALQNTDEGCAQTKACCAHLYTLVRGDRKHRRALMQGLLNMFDDTVKSELDLLYFVADNLAHFPYITQDEPLYVISQIEVYVSVSGSNVLQSFKEALVKHRPKAKKLKKKKSPKPHSDDLSNSSDTSSSSSESESEGNSSNVDISDTEEEEGIINRLPEEDAPLIEFIESSMACLLLLMVKQHIKSVFGFTDNKIHRYSPSEPAKAHDKQVMKKRPDQVFQPGNVHEYLRKKLLHMLPEHPAQDSNFKIMVAKQYFEFNDLMNKLDPNDMDSDSDKELPAKNSEKSVATKDPSTFPAVAGEGLPNTDRQNEEHESDNDSDAELPRKPTALDVIRNSGVNKHKKKLLKSRQADVFSQPESPSIPKELRTRKKAVKYVELSDSEDSGEFLGF